MQVPYRKTESTFFGKTGPKDGDVYQQLALDTLLTNQISMLRGPAGSGKSYLAFSAMFDMLEHHKISKIIIFCNTVATKGSAKLGFYPGSRTEKLLDSQIGNFLESKLGGRDIVEDMIAGNLHIYGRTNSFVYENNQKNNNSNLTIFSANRARNGYYRVTNN